jgi:hypothetical protein
VIPGDVSRPRSSSARSRSRRRRRSRPSASVLLEKFAEFGVTKEQIEKRIQRHLDAMTPAQMVDLGKKYNSLKDGMSTAADWFEPSPR